MRLPKELCQLMKIEHFDVELEKASYGLKQAAQLWNALLHQHITEFGFKQNPADPCVYTYNHNDKILHIGIYVDDLLIISSDLETKLKFINFMKRKVKSLTIHDDDDLEFLGMSIKHVKEEHAIYLSQERYAMEIVEEFLPDGAPESKYPIGNKDLSIGEPDKFTPLHEVIGKCRYLADRTRPDLLYTLAYLARFMNQPSEEVMIETLRFLGYLKRTSGYKMKLGSKTDIKLFAASDAAYNQKEDCKSQLGVCVYLSSDSAPVLNRSIKATTVSLSSTQAEVEATIEAIKEVLWFHEFLTNLQIVVDKPTIILVDNRPTVILGDDGDYLKRSKHFLVKTMFIREQTSVGNMILRHVPGTMNHADILTKPLQGHLLEQHTCGLLGCDAISLLRMRLGYIENEPDQSLDN